MGECYNCGQWGHSAKNCPSVGHGFTGACYNCGVQGRSAKFCPSSRTPKGKGKHGSWDKGKGGAREVRHEEEKEWADFDESGQDIGGIWQIAGENGKFFKRESRKRNRKSRQGIETSGHHRARAKGKMMRKETSG